LGCGLSEAVTWGIGSPDIYATYGYGEEKPIRLSNPVGEEMSVLRTSLVPGLLLSLGRNQRHGARSVRLFEIGTTFHSRAPVPEEDERDSKLPLEVVRVGLLLWGERHDGRWYGGGERIDFGDLSGVLENLAEALNLEHAIERQPATMANLHPLAGARLVLDGEAIGLAGQLHPERADALELGGPVYVAELSMAALVAADRRRIVYTPIPRFPGTRRDVAVVVDREVPSENIRRFLQENAGGELGEAVIERVRLFDVYQGKGIAKSKISLAFGIDYRHAERTLTDAEVNEAFDTVVERLKTELDVEVRQ
jgi:phenylalanyl-tRNA synthetase beta chain